MYCWSSVPGTTSRLLTIEPAAALHGGSAQQVVDVAFVDLPVLQGRGIADARGVVGDLRGQLGDLSLDDRPVGHFEAHQPGTKQKRQAQREFGRRHSTARNDEACEAAH